MPDQDEPGGGSPGPALPGDDFVARLVSDPADPPRTRLLSGWLGASNEEGHTRIYFDPELAGYADVRNDDILHTEPSGEEGPLARTLVWIRADAEALHGPAGGARQRAGFFAGPVWDENVAATVPGGSWDAYGTPVVHRTPPQLPPPTYFGCPPRTSQAAGCEGCLKSQVRPRPQAASAPRCRTQLPTQNNCPPPSSPGAGCQPPEPSYSPRDVCCVKHTCSLPPL